MPWPPLSLCVPQPEMVDQAYSSLPSHQWDEASSCRAAAVASLPCALLVTVIRCSPADHRNLATQPVALCTVDHDAMNPAGGLCKGAACGICNYQMACMASLVWSMVQNTHFLLENNVL